VEAIGTWPVNTPMSKLTSSFDMRFRLALILPIALSNAALSTEPRAPTFAVVRDAGLVVAALRVEADDAALDRAAVSPIRCCKSPRLKATPPLDTIRPGSP